VSRKVIQILFIIGSCLYIPGIALIAWGYVALFQATASAQNAAYYSGYSDTSSFNNGFATFFVLFLLGAALTSLGGITVLVARIGALIELGKAQEWVWFVLLLIFGWIVLLVYLIAGPKPKPALQYGAYPYAVPGQFTPGYPPPVPGMMPPPAQPWPNYPPPPMQQPWAEYPPRPE
jgi:hypothetical protein